MEKRIAVEELLAAGDTKELVQGLDFEHALKLMEDLVQRVESGSLSLDKSIRSYEKGVELIEHLRGLLAGAEAKLKVLQKQPEEGEIQF